MRPEWLTLVDCAGVKVDRVRREMLRQLGDPETPYVGHDYRWCISIERLESMIRFYHGSRFYKDYDVEMDFWRQLRGNPAGHEGRLWAFSVVYEEVMR